MDGNRKVPSARVTKDLVPIKEGDLIETSTPGRKVPPSSVTTPLREPVCLWANMSEDEKKISKAMPKILRVLLFFTFYLLFAFLSIYLKLLSIEADFMFFSSILDVHLLPIRSDSSSKTIPHAWYVLRIILENRAFFPLKLIIYLHK